MRSEKMDDFRWADGGGISETSDDRSNIILWLWDQTIRRRLLSVGTASQEFKLWCTWALGDSNSSGKLDKIACSDVVVRQEGCKEVHRINDTEVSVEVGLNGGE